MYTLEDYRKELYKVFAANFEMPYRTTRQNNLYFKTPSDTFGYVHMFIYARSRAGGFDVFRIKSDCFDPNSHAFVRREIAFNLDKILFELSFHPDEIQEVAEWVCNYILIRHGCRDMKPHLDIDPRWGFNKENETEGAYFWTMKGWELYQNKWT